MATGMPVVVYNNITINMKLPPFLPQSLSKRRKFVFSTLILSIFLLATILTSGEWQFRFVGIMSLASLFVTAWSLGSDWKGISRLTTSIFSILFVAGVGMFTFLLPTQVTEFWIFPVASNWGITIAWAIKIVFWLLFAVGYYSLLLTENIFAVSTIRTIQLARAANAVGFLLILVTAFLGFDTLLSFRLPFYWNFFGAWSISLPLVLIGLWSIKLEEKLDFQMLISSLTLSLVIGYFSAALSFWPVSITVGSLALTTSMYVLLGLYQQELVKRMFKRTVYEYLSVGISVFLIILLTTKWGG
jgi:hypothetical protein